MRTYATIDEILRDTDETLGKLTAIVSDFNNFEESRHAYLLYITMIGLECIELVELKFIYLESEVEKKNIENRKNEIIKEAIIITEKLINESWRKTNGRFRLVMNQFSEY